MQRLTRQLAFALILAAAPALFAAGKVTRYVIVSGDSTSGSWDGHADGRLKQWRAKYGSHYAWFSMDGRDYLVSDERTLADFERAMAPQRAVNLRQEEVNSHQEEVNRHQEDVNRRQEAVNHQQSLVNEGSGSQARVNELQSEVNGKQQKVNQQQSVVNREQDAVNQLQRQASVEVNRALQVVFENAVRQGTAHEVH